MSGGPLGSPAGGVSGASSGGRADPGADGQWHRLHPLSPLIAAGRLLPAVLIVLVLSVVFGAHNSGDIYRLIVVGVIVVIGVISWAVTRWKVEPGVLRIERGLLRRSLEQYPLNQVQAIDTVRPGLARLLNMAELRLQMAGAGGSTGKLAYLRADHAEALRARLLAMAHDLAGDAVAPPEQPLLRVHTDRLVASMLITGPMLAVEAIVVVLVVLAVAKPSLAGGLLSGGAAGFLGLLSAVWQRFNSGYRMTVAEAPDGLRLRSGLVETSAETIPRGRVQAIRMREPFLWQLLGWCRVEVVVAGKGVSRKQNAAARRAERTLLPVGTREDAAWLIERVFAGLPDERLPPPARARWKSPLRYRRLSWGSNERYVVATTGRLRRSTDWIPLSKVQSIRRVEGPVQRRMRLASVHLDAAGRRIHAELRDRDKGEADELMVSLPARCREARRRDGRPRVYPG